MAVHFCSFVNCDAVEHKLDIKSLILVNFCLNMLLITSVESMENASIKVKGYCRTNKNCRFPVLIKAMRSHLEKLEKSHKSDTTVQDFLKEMNAVIESVRTIAESP